MVLGESVGKMTSEENPGREYLGVVLMWFCEVKQRLHSET